MIETILALPLRLRIDDLGNLNVACFLDRPLRLIAEFIERLFFVEVVLDGLFLWVTCDSPFKLKNVKVFGTFHRFFKNVRGVSWSEVATVPKRKSHRGLDLDLSWNSEEIIWKGRKESNGIK